MKREFLQSLQVNGQSLPKEVIDAIMEENGRDIQAGKVWQEKYNQAVADHQHQLRQLEFGGLLQAAIAQAKGRNPKAIAALLDVEALQQSDDPKGAIAQALTALQQQEGYLFETQTPPPYARSTGAASGPMTAPATLAGALRERFETRKER